MRLAALLHCLLAPLALAGSPRIAFERVLPAAHDLGRNRDVAIVHAVSDTPRLETFIEHFVDQASHSGFHRIRDARFTTGPADVFLVIKIFKCESATREGEGSVRDHNGNRVKRLLQWEDAVCHARVDVMSREMKWRSSFYGKGEGTSPRVEHLTDEERDVALAQAARYTAVDAAERITPRRVKEMIPLDETAPAFDEGMPLIDSGRLPEARAKWEAALRHHPRNAPLHFNLAALCEALGDRKAAQSHYSIARQLAPKEERYASELRLFERRQ
ncbi:MAG TPA: tetratricopeptide repeat protein [Thermoanaerobaculia bacterium]